MTTTNIAGQLRREAERAVVTDDGSECCAAPHWTCCNPMLLKDAADEIERLRAENERLQRTVMAIKAKAAYGKSQAVSARDAAGFAIDYLIDVELLASRDPSGTRT